MGIKFFVSGTRVDIHNIDDATTHDNLPAKVYTIAQDLSGMYLVETKERLEEPSKIYGKTMDRVTKIIATFDSRQVSTGVLLTGTKGSGKTLISTLVANALLDRGLPVILINAPFRGDGFMNFLNSIGECALVFDEFAKTYSTSEEDFQDDILTMLDGVSSTRRLVMFTENKESEISEFMLNRPGRIFYHFKYDKLDTDSIKDFCIDKGLDESVIEEITDIQAEMKTFSFDILQAVVEEYKRFGGRIIEIITDLNIEYDPSSKTRMQITKIIRTSDGVELEPTLDSLFIDKPVYDYTYFYYKIPLDEQVGSDEEYDEDRARGSLGFARNNMKLDKDGLLVYDTGHFTIVCEVQAPTYTSWKSYLN